ncbi:PD-(D/E)XK motif protein [Bradyrhizobium paxllaeri]|uniref:PD-(D/E)XK motif protein n=1 Tax=Bradyrhizobium paxllaeri TaxID=190148 RepID=UPI000810B60F|nr:PD-(D/E)XK motif protein [Bradyrhizobium paxllaeri]
MPDQWSEIPASSHPGLNNVRRVEVRYPLDFRRGKDFHGRYIFVLEGACDTAQLPAPPKLAGIDVAALFDEAGNCRLTLTLLDPKSLEIFRALCHDLLSATAKLPRGDNGTGLLVVLARLYEWQGLLKRRYEKILSTPEMVGLFGELLFLRDCLVPVLGLDAPSSWRGSFRDEQDFVVGSWIIEVKTQLSTSDQRIFISSEAQLDTSSGNILLCHQTLGASTAGNSSSRSLNHIVDEIAALLGPVESPPGLEFQLGLLKADYTRRSEYDETHWVLASRRLFSVEDGFPKITPATLAQGIERVAYQIRVEACLPFETDLDKAMEQIVGKRI